MKINLQRVMKRIDFSEYAPEYSGAVIDCRVNVTRGVLERMRSVNENTTDAEMFALLHELWGDDWPVADIEALYAQCAEMDPQLWRWLVERTWTLVMEYQGMIKKK